MTGFNGEDKRAGRLMEVVDDWGLRSEVKKLRHLLNQSNEELILYRRMTYELKGRLNSMQADCNHKQKLMLQTLLSWMGLQTDRKRQI